MNTQALKKRVALLACGAIGSLLLTSVSVADSDRDVPFELHTLEGAWQVEVTVRVAASDCTTAAPVQGGPNPFPSFNTFHEGGTMSEFGTRSPPANRGPGHGVWERLGPSRFGYRLMFHSFGADGLLMATMDIKTRVKLSRDGEKFTGVSRFVRTDLSGNVLNFCATMKGKRFTF